MEEIQEESIELLGDTRDNRNKRRKAKTCVSLVCCGVSLLTVCTIVVLAFVVLFVLAATSPKDAPQLAQNVTCDSKCRLSIVETIPVNLSYPSSGATPHMSTYHAWKELLKLARKNLTISSSYWTLRGSDEVHDPTDHLGEDIFNDLFAAGKKRGIDIRIVQGSPDKTFPNNDTKVLADAKVAKVRSLNLTKLLGGGIIHTKMWIVDDEHFYIGSANMDWRSLIQVKELGILGINCSCLAQDAQKMFEVYWSLSADDVTEVPSHWPDSLTASFNINNTASLKVNGTQSNVFFGSAPPQILTRNRTSDITALLNVIHSANKFVYIAVMDYLPIIMYSWPMKYWPDIDDALRTAAFERGVQVRLLGSHWSHTPKNMVAFMKSFSPLVKIGHYNGAIETKLFVVPLLSNASIPFTRVNHNKYMVTDNAAYIGTSNWSGDYFVDTAGVSCIVNQTSSVGSGITIQEELKKVFERDWNSTYAKNISDFT